MHGPGAGEGRLPMLVFYLMLKLKPTKLKPWKFGKNLTLVLLLFEGK